VWAVQEARDGGGSARSAPNMLRGCEFFDCDPSFVANCSTDGGHAPAIEPPHNFHNCFWTSRMQGGAFNIDSKEAQISGRKHRGVRCADQSDLEKIHHYIV